MAALIHPSQPVQRESPINRITAFALSSAMLSRWALEHIPLIRYLIVALLLGGVMSYGRLG